MKFEILSQLAQSKNIMFKSSIIIFLFYSSLTILFTITSCSESRSFELKRWGYIYHNTLDPQKNFSYFKSVVSRYDIICVTGFKLHSNGTLRIYYKNFRKLLNFCRKNSIIFYPLISFSNVKSGISILNSKSYRTTALNHIDSLIVKNNLKGIHLDFEYLPVSYAGKLSGFIEFLSKNLKKRHNDFFISMALFPKIDFNSSLSDLHDYKLLAPHLDSIVLMCYDLYNSKTSPGPVTDLKWAEKNIHFTMQYFNHNKIWLGIPAYGYSWNQNGNARVISSRHAKSKYAGKYLKRHNSGTSYITWNDNNGSGIVYFSDLVTRSLLSDIAVKYKLRGTALWRLGLEDN